MIQGYSPIVQALIASLFTWGVTALGAAVVFVMKSNSKKLLDISLGFAAGVMTAASFWSLLAPAIEISQATMGSYAFLPVAVGFAAGAGFVYLADSLVPSCVMSEDHLLKMISPSKDTEMTLLADPPSVPNLQGSSDERGEVRIQPASQRVSDSAAVSSLHESWRRILLLILAVTVHNIPEGLAVGVGFGSIGLTNAATFESAFNLALGIGLQNFPEGLAVSLPLAAFGYPKWKAFLYGQMSGMVEPIAAVVGAAAVMLMAPVRPYALSFAAGAMIYVVVDDIIPEAQRHGNGKLASLGAISGFIVMMCLDVGLG